MASISNEEVGAWFRCRIQLEGFHEELWTPKMEKVVSDWCDDLDATTLFLWVGENTEEHDGDGDERQPHALHHWISTYSREETARSKDRVPEVFRSGAVKSLTFYFKRQKEEVSARENLPHYVQSGAVSGDVVDHLLLLMNSVFVPMSMADHAWPDNVRKEFTAQVQKFMSSTTEMANNARGATVLYIPDDDLSDLEAASKDKDLVQRLEASLIHWTRQIKELTTQQDSTHEAESAGPLEEIEFWRARDVDLSRLYKQLKSPELQRILSLLEIAKSSYMKQFRSLETGIMNGSIEAQENLKFLECLQGPCEQLAKATPNDIPALLPKVLHCVRMIWTISTHYNTADRISGLLRKISNEIIRRCQATIDLDLIFEGDVDKPMQQLKLSIECGKHWKTAYQQAKRLVKTWNFQVGSIFAQVDAFVQRCCDLLEICEGQLQFACTARGVKLPVFGGSRAPEVIKSIQEIENTFLRQIAVLKGVDYDILDVKATRWHDTYSTFKNQMKDMEVMYLNTINSAFEGVSTVVGVIEVVDNFYVLAHRERIRTFVEKKCVEVYTLFTAELLNVKKEFEHLRRKPLLPILQGHPNHAGTALWAKGLMHRISADHEALQALCYVENCREKEQAEDQYQSVHMLLESFVHSTFSDWVQGIKALDDTTLPKRLQQPLLARGEDPHRGSKSGMLESNFDRNLLRMFQEVYYWEKIQGSGIVVPYAAHELASNRDQLRVLREHVLRVVREYNIIIAALHADERRLFHQHIRNLDRKISPGITKYNWFNSGIKDFFVRPSCHECTKVWDYVKQFKENNRRINDVCREMSEQHLIKIEKKVVYRDSEFKDLQEKHRAKVEKQLTLSAEKITELLLSSYQYFESQGADIQREWRHYVEKVDRRVEDALKRAVKTSLQELCRALNGDTKAEAVPLFRISAVLEGSKMDFLPTTGALKDLLQVVCRDMTMTLTAVPRSAEQMWKEKAKRDLVKKQKLEAEGDVAAANAIVIQEDDGKPKRKSFYEEISKDDECCIRYVKDVLKGFNLCAVKLGEKLKWWNSSYQPIVSQDKDAFIRRYSRTERSLQGKGQDIQRYKDVQADIQQEEYKLVIGFIETDFQLLKHALVEHCVQWQGKLQGLLNQQALKELNTVLEYFEQNSVVLLQTPKDFDELKARIKLMDSCKKDVQTMEDRFKPIEDMYAKLAEFEVVPTEEEVAKKSAMRPRFEEFQKTLDVAGTILVKSKKAMKGTLENDMINFAQSIKELRAAFTQNAPFKSEGLPNEKAFGILKGYTDQVKQKREMEAGFMDKLELFLIDAPQYKELVEIEKELESLQTIWDLKQEWDTDWEGMKTSSFQGINCDEFDERAGKYQKRIIKLKQQMLTWPVWQKLKQETDVFRQMMPLITDLRHPALRERHWEGLKKEIPETFDPFSDDFALSRCFDLRFNEHAG
jgi:dynein heavy chain